VVKDQMKLAMQARKLQKELKKEIIVVETGGGAVQVEITGEQKLKKITIDPNEINLDDIGELEQWLEEGVREAIAKSQQIAAEKMQPLMGALGNLGM